MKFMLLVNMQPETIVKHLLIAAIVLLIMIFGLRQLHKFKP
jgi:purine-cytosine permease-like protein